jgi:hypothetical protein
MKAWSRLLLLCGFLIYFLKGFCGIQEHFLPLSNDWSVVQSHWIVVSLLPLVGTVFLCCYVLRAFTQIAKRQACFFSHSLSYQLTTGSSVAFTSNYASTVPGSKSTDPRCQCRIGVVPPSIDPIRRVLEVSLDCLWVSFTMSYVWYFDGRQKVATSFTRPVISSDQNLEPGSIGIKGHYSILSSTLGILRS